jgi:hypothetical protein
MWQKRRGLVNALFPLDKDHGMRNAIKLGLCSEQI